MMCWQVACNSPFSSVSHSRSWIARIYSCDDDDEISGLFAEGFWICSFLGPAAVGAQNVMRQPPKLVPTMKLSGTTNTVAAVAAALGQWL